MTWYRFRAKAAKNVAGAVVTSGLLKVYPETDPNGAGTPAPIRRVVEGDELATLGTGAVLTNVTVTSGVAEDFDADLPSPRAYMKSGSAPAVFVLSETGYLIAAQSAATSAAQSLIAAQDAAQDAADAVAAAGTLGDPQIANAINTLTSQTRQALNGLFASVDQVAERVRWIDGGYVQGNTYFENDAIPLPTGGFAISLVNHTAGGAAPPTATNSFWRVVAGGGGTGTGDATRTTTAGAVLQNADGTWPAPPTGYLWVFALRVTTTGANPSGGAWDTTRVVLLSIAS